MIKIKNEEQLTELAARGVYLLSGLRAFQREYEETRAIYSLHKDVDCEAWELRCDNWLKEIDAVDFMPLKQLIEELKISQP